MRRSLWTLAIVLGLVAAWSIGRVQAQGDKATFADPNHATFTAMPDAGRAGVSTATLWGDPTAGAAGTYTKFVPGWDAGWHTHTADVWIVGIKRRLSLQGRSRGEARKARRLSPRAWRS